MQVNGRYDPIFEAVADRFRENFTERDDVGASFALSRDGEMVVDIWAGHLDEERTEPWAEDSLVNVYSTTKTMTALSALLLADRGELDFDVPVARYWPEFAQAGKEDVRVSHLMSHTAGLSGLDEPTTAEDLYDWQKITSLLAAQAPWWKPGTASGYHALTQGYLTGEVVRRITGRTLGTFFREELAEPLGADFHIGLPEHYDGRVGRMIPPGPVDLTAGLDPESVAARTFANPAVKAESSWTPEWRRAEIPAANGHGNARSVVRAQTLLACGGEVGGRRLMSEAGCRKALEVQTDTTDLVLGVPLRHGLGYGITSEAIPLSPNPNTCFWGGWGGSSIVVDLDARLCFSYVMNRMEAGVMGDPRGALLAEAVYSSLASAGS
jgi:CubicO group peptidase (beta-lactamase class C family)